jgi:sulfur carrier protein
MTAIDTRLRTLTVNGTPVRAAAATLAALIAEQGFAGLKVATALNGTFVPERLRAETLLADGDRIEILSARQGG